MNLWELFEQDLLHTGCFSCRPTDNVKTLKTKLLY